MRSQETLNTRRGRVAENHESETLHRPPTASVWHVDVRGVVALWHPWNTTGESRSDS